MRFGFGVGRTGQLPDASDMHYERRSRRRIVSDDDSVSSGGPGRPFHMRHLPCFHKRMPLEALTQTDLVPSTCPADPIVGMEPRPDDSSALDLDLPTVERSTIDAGNVRRPATGSAIPVDGPGQ